MICMGVIKSRMCWRSSLNLTLKGKWAKRRGSLPNPCLGEVALGKWQRDTAGVFYRKMYGTLWQSNGGATKMKQQEGQREVEGEGAGQWAVSWGRCASRSKDHPHLRCAHFPLRRPQLLPLTPWEARWDEMTVISSHTNPGQGRWPLCVVWRTCMSQNLRVPLVVPLRGPCPLRYR